MSCVISLSITNQSFSIFTIRAWGKYSHPRYSNKTIIAIEVPLYIVCLIAWCFAGIYQQEYMNIILLAVIYITTGVSTAGNQSVVYQHWFEAFP